MTNPDSTQESIMSTAIADNIQSLMSDFGVDLTDLNSTDLLAELVSTHSISGPFRAKRCGSRPAFAACDFEVTAQLD